MSQLVKYLIGGVILGALIGGSLYFSYVYHACQIPSKLEVRQAYVSCAKEELDKAQQNSLSWLCNLINQDSNCDITKYNENVFVEAFNAKMKSCTLASLKKNNFCTDKVKED